MTEYFTLEQARSAATATDAIAEAIGVPFSVWANNCHSVSLAILRTGWFGPGRMARGMAAGPRGQHSWIVLGEDVYAPKVPLVDPTIVPLLRHMGIAGTNAPGGLPDIMVEYACHLSHRPHGMGSIWQYGRPDEPTGPVIGLTPSFELSRTAQLFLEILGPLDRRGWMVLASGVMQGWPAAEIIAAMDDTEELKALVPIDILGMLTDRNPGKLYF